MIFHEKNGKYWARLRSGEVVIFESREERDLVFEEFRKIEEVFGRYPEKPWEKKLEKAPSIIIKKSVECEILPEIRLNAEFEIKGRRQIF